MIERLPPEELAKVWLDYHKSCGRDERNILIENYVHLVKYVLGRIAVTLPSHVRVEDMYATGVMGLVKAIEKYDSTRKNKFETYAILLIKGAIIDEMRKLDWVPRSVHQKAKEIATTQQALGQKLGREATDDEVAQALGLTTVEYDKLVERVRPAVMIPINAENKNDDSGPIADRIPDPKVRTSYENADHNEFKKMLEKAVLELPEQERTVLVLYYYENLMLKEIGAALGVSESRVSQIHTKALLRMKGRLHNFAEEFANLL